MSDAGRIAGHQRVAAFLLSLEPEVARGILRHLHEDVVGEVARAMMDLDPRLESEDLDGIYGELARHLHGPRRVRPKESDELAELLRSTFGKAKGDELFAKIDERRRGDRPFLEIEHHPPARIAFALRAESPAVAALVLVHVPPDLAADVLRHEDEERAVGIVQRMANLRSTSPELLRTIASDLEQRLDALVAEGVSLDEDRLESIAELLNHTPPEMERRVIEKLDEADADMASELREHLFRWEDIATVDRRSMQKILGTVDTKTLALALKACSEAVESNVMGNLSSRVRDMVTEERELSGPVPMTDVQSAREEIMKNVRAMIEAGEFRPTRAGEDLVS